MGRILSLLNFTVGNQVMFLNRIINLNVQILLKEVNMVEIDKRNQQTFDYVSLNEPFLYTTSKRILDIFLSFLGIVFGLLFFIIVALVIKLDDPKGPVFFHQVRVGKNGKEFKMYKFRSMYADAEERLEELLKYNEIEGAMFKMKDDPRITRVGKIIRKYSIDEIPQLYNVLIGDMSLVGPRPPLPREVKKYSLYDKQRLLVKPGITGLWQISGRNSLTFDQMVNLDIKYIEQTSIWKDIIILIKTIRVVILKKDAY